MPVHVGEQMNMNSLPYTAIALEANLILMKGALAFESLCHTKLIQVKRAVVS